MAAELYRRQCQTEALATVASRYNDQVETNLSMCTGAGKTFVIVDVCHLPGVNRTILVFPSLPLIQQFARDHKGSFGGKNLFYFATEGTLHGIRRISAAFIELAFDTLTILTTYVSAPVLLTALSDKRQLDMLITDEAHHITGPVFSAAYAGAATFIRHTVHFSATLPETKVPHYKYPLLKAIRDGVVRDFNIELFICKGEEETGVLQMIDKLVALHNGKAKILIYTAEANTDGSSVRTFMAKNEAAVRERGWWIEGINADTNDKDRDPILRAFEADKSPASILVSCRTLSEGIDLKNANCMLPWDPSASVTGNIQRIGRVVRLYKTAVGAVAKDQPPSTILIPVFVEEADYAACSGDRAAVHALLEKQISEGEKGNFRPIVNVCTALKSELAEEDSDLFNQLLNYPFTPKVRVDRDLVTCVAAQLKKSVGDVLEEVAAALIEKGEMDEEMIDAIREGDLEQEDAGGIITALAESQKIRLVIRDKDEEEIIGKGSKEIIIERKGEGVYTASKKKKSDAAARQRVAHRLRTSFSDGCQVLLGLEAVDLDATEGMVLARLTAEVQYDEDWEKRRLEWVAAYEKFGIHMSHASKDPQQRRAGLWQHKQRQDYSSKKQCLTIERITALNNTYGWIWIDNRWEENRINWIAIYEKLGCKKPSANSKDPAEKRAGHWQQTQRGEYRNKLDRMTSERISILESIPGWTWEDEETWEPARLRWEFQYQKLGRSPIQSSLSQDERRAGQWQTDQRKRYKHDKLSHDKIQLLNTTIGWQWDADDTWLPSLLHWSTVYTKLGNKTPAQTSSEPNERRAGQWQSQQRTAYRTKSLTAERIKALETTEGWEWEKEETWETQRLYWVDQFKKLKKNPSPMSKDIEEKRAGQWGHSQRNSYKEKNGRLTEGRIKTLNETEGWKWHEEDTWEPRRQQWILIYTKLGNKYPSDKSNEPDIKSAGQWQSDQRKRYKKGIIEVERIDALNNTPGWIWGEEDPWEGQRIHWFAMFSKLGNKNPSNRSKNLEEKRAGVWQGNQRHDFKNNKLTPENIAALNATPGWKWCEEDTWELNRLQWVAIYEELGKTPSQHSNDLEEKQIGQWQSNQRKHFKKKDASMTPERISVLESTEGWLWVVEDTWEPNRHHWISQHQKLGRNLSEKSTNLEEKRAGKWQSHQRQDYKNKTMIAERIATLNKTPGWSWSADLPPVTPALTDGDVIEHVNDDDVEGPERKRYMPTGEGTPTGSQDRAKSQLELLHKAYKTRNADTYFSLMQTDPTKFEEYHAIADVHDARDSPERKPQNRIAEMLKKNNRASYMAIDLGCGRNHLRSDERVFKMTWTAVDVVAADPTVTVADMGALPFEDESFDIAILNRSLWAKNHAVVLREVHRILKEGGRAILCESFQRWFSDGENTLLTALKDAGFTVISEEGTTPDSSVSVFQYIEVRRG